MTSSSGDAGPSNLPSDEIETFKSLTQCSDEQARFYLGACSGQLDQAVARYYDDEGGGEGGAALDAAYDARYEAAARYQDEAGGLEEPARRNARGPMALVRRGFGGLLEVVRIAASIVGTLGAQFLPANLLHLLQGALRTLTMPRVSDPVEDARKFCEEFQEQYGREGPNFVPLDWQDVTQQAHAQLKLIFIYLHSPHHEDSERFCRNTLCNGELARYVNDNFICWGGDIRRSEPFKLSQRLRVTGYPYICLLAYSGSRVRLAAFTHGYAPPDRLLAVLKDVNDAQSAQYVVERAERQERDFNRTLREEQDAAYQQSLLEDMEREQQRQAARQVEEDKRRAEQEAADQQRREKELEEQQVLNKAASIQTRQSQKAESLRPEPIAGGSEPIVAVRIRLPNGVNCQRRFGADRPIQDVYDFVDSLEDFKVWEYNLVTSYPKKVLSKDLLHQSFQDLGLAPQATLFVQTLDD